MLNGHELVWHRSTRCGNGACVEVARIGDRYLMRDTKNLGTEPLAFTDRQWSAFTTGLKAGRFS